MSLRTQIHDAIDEVGRPDPALPREMAALVQSHAERRLRWVFPWSRGWSVGIRRAASLVAATLIVVLMIGLVLTGRVWRDQGIFGTAPHTVDQAKLSQLHARPLLLSAVQAGGLCPDGPYTPFDPRSRAWGYGRGPIYSEGSGTRYVTPVGTYFETVYAAGAPTSGPVLIRARDLKTNQAVVFAAPDNFYSGTPIGKVVGTDTVIGKLVQLHAELLLDPSRESQADGWEVVQGFPKGASGCIGFQVDGFNANGKAFTEVFVVSYTL